MSLPNWAPRHCKNRCRMLLWKQAIAHCGQDEPPTHLLLYVCLSVRPHSSACFRAGGQEPRYSLGYITWELVRNAASQATPYMCCLRNCILTRSPGDSWAHKSWEALLSVIPITEIQTNEALHPGLVNFQSKTQAAGAKG